MRGEDLTATSSPFLRFVHDLGRRRSTGVLALGGPGDALPIREGGVVLSEGDVLGRRASERLARAAASPGAAWGFREESLSIQLAQGPALPLVRWVRRHAEREIDPALAARLTADLAGARVGVRAGRALDPSQLDAADRLLAGALARPRTLAELASLARAPRFRVLAFVHFLRSIGALAVLRGGAAPPLERAAPSAPALAEPPPERAAPTAPARPDPPRAARSGAARAAALALLGLPAGADVRRVKAAFRGLARTLHPDLHPGAGEHRRRELERRLATLNAAYASLTTG